MLGDLSRCNYCESGPVQDSKQHLLLASRVCYSFTPTGLKLSKLGISYNRYHVLLCSLGLHLSGQVYVEQVELLVKLILCSVFISLFSLNLLTMNVQICFNFSFDSDIGLKLNVLYHIFQNRFCILSGKNDLLSTNRKHV